MNTLYQNSKVMKSLKEYFEPYLKSVTEPSGKKLFSMFIAMIALQEVRSIRFLYQWFMGKTRKISLNAYYYMLSSAKISLDKFSCITLRIALSCIPKDLQGQPIFLIIDDTMQEKYGTHFECYQKMFDHAKHNGTNYLNGHCFVALTVSVPVWIGEHIHYLCVPLGYKMRQEGQNKLEIAASMVENVMPVLTNISQIILLTDSWYPKGAVRKTVAKYENLELIANVRVDSKLFEVPPPPTGKRGRPAKKGKRLDIHTDFKMEQVGDYFVGARRAISSLFTKAVHITVTATRLEDSSTYRVFLSTIMPDEILMNLAAQEKLKIKDLPKEQLWLLPYYLYSFRWSIEVVFYEQKTFWSLGQYMLRSRPGIENYVNLLAVVYSAVQLLPFVDSKFFALRSESPQNQKYLISEAIHQEVFFYSFVDSLENTFNSCALKKAFDSLPLFMKIS